MSAFLSELERELRAAHPRRRAARRRASAARAVRAAPVAVVVLLVLAGATAFVLAVGREEARVGATSAPAPAEILAPPGDGAAGRRLTVVNATSTPGLDARVARFLRPGDPVARVTDGARAGVERTTVWYAPGSRGAAEEIALLVGVPARPLGPAVRVTAPGASVVVEVAEDITGVGSTPLLDARGRQVPGRLDFLLRRGRPAVVSLRAPREPGRSDGIWLLDTGAEPRAPRFLGYVPPGSRTLEAFFPVSLRRGARLVLSREVGREVGREPRQVLLYADV